MSFSFFPASLLGCSVLIKWGIPSGIYVDPYQLQASVMNKTVCFSSHVNIEQMAHHAEPLTLHSFAQPSMWEQLQLLPINPVSSALSSP
jgi:hypothetical protein